jgi:methionyl-tRNA formyltransferase
MTLKIVFFGTPDFVIPVLKSLDEQYLVVGVVTAPDTIQGRKKILTPTPVKQYASDKNIPILTPQQYNNETIQHLHDLSAELFIVAAYGKIIPKDILAIPKYGALNIHPSLLPKYRGPSPIQSALLNGDKESGITIIKMDEKMDHGPIVTQEKLPLTSDDTFEKLHGSMFQKAAEMLPESIKQYVNGTLQPKEQDHANAAYCHMITKQDGYFAIDNPPDPVTLDRMIRAYYPWPTAWTTTRIKNHESRIMKLLPNDMFQMEGGKPMGVKELLNGHPEIRETIQKLGLNTKY